MTFPMYGQEVRFGIEIVFPDLDLALYHNVKTIRDRAFDEENISGISAFLDTEPSDKPNLGVGQTFEKGNLA